MENDRKEVIAMLTLKIRGWIFTYGNMISDLIARAIVALL